METYETTMYVVMQENFPIACFEFSPEAHEYVAKWKNTCDMLSIRQMTVTITESEQ